MSKDSFDEMLREEERMSEERVRVNEQPDANMTEDGSKSNSANEAAAVAFIFFFIAEMIAIPVLGAIDILFGAACFGLLLLVIGISTVKQKITWDNYTILMIPIIGLGLTVLPIVDYFSKKKTGETFFTLDHITIIFCSVFSIVGILLIFMPLIERHFMLKKCTETVTAKCIYIDKRRTHRNQARNTVTTINHGRRTRNSTVYAPKWEYSIGGKVYQTQERSYTNVGIPSIGEEHKIFVNPNDPNQIYRSNIHTYILSLIMAAVAIGLSALTIYFVFFADSDMHF